MSSAAFNLSKNLEWMSRRLRHINDPSSIQEWIAAMNSILSLMQSLVAKTDVHIDGWRPSKAPTKIEREAPRVTIEKCRGNMEDKNEREDTPVATALRPPPERTTKPSFKQMTCIKENITLSETQTSTANGVVTGKLDVDMKKARPHGRVCDIPSIMPPRVELGTSSSESCSTEDIVNIEAAKNLLTSEKNSQALKERLKEEDVSVSHWESNAYRLKKLFEVVEDDLRLTRGSLFGSEKQTFLLKELLMYYQT